MFFWKSLAKAHPDPSVTFFEEGTMARAAGRSRSTNPYCCETVAHAEWLEGWRATFDLDEDDDCESSRYRDYPECRA